MNPDAEEEEFIGNEPKASRAETIDNTSVILLLKISIVFVFGPLIISSNCFVLVALYRFKRLRTASNYFLASLAFSDLGVGLSTSVTFYAQLLGKEETHLSITCYLPLCSVVALCAASILIMAAIAVDRFTSLAQPLKYNNMITRTSVHRYIIGFWIYAFIIGVIPFVYRNDYRIVTMESFLKCDLDSILDYRIRLIFVCAVVGPCTLIILGCYGYIYVVARYHAKAIYTVEISLRQHQDGGHHRYGRTLALTVGIFLLLWLPFQVCVLSDAIRGSFVSRTWVRAYLITSTILSSILNPWIYAYKNTEMRIGIVRVVRDLLACIGYKSVGYWCPVDVIMASAYTDEIISNKFNKRLSSRSNLTNSTLAKHNSVIMSSLPDSIFIPAPTNAKNAGNTIIYSFGTTAHLV